VKEMEAWGGSLRQSKGEDMGRAMGIGLEIKMKMR
jgi:hypothetical protein